jgi:molybdopterin-biosynthesis enzyme MoeA-like protein
MSETEKIYCRACKKEITWALHRVRVILVNGAPGPTTDRTDDFHYECAASIFHTFDGIMTRRERESIEKAQRLLRRSANELEDMLFSTPATESEKETER